MRQESILGYGNKAFFVQSWRSGGRRLLQNSCNTLPIDMAISSRYL